jgi:hypothetical protein
VLEADLLSINCEEEEIECSNGPSWDGSKIYNNVEGAKVVTNAHSK